MKEFDYIIIGGGCAGLSLAYELDFHEKLKDKTLAIVEPRQEYKRDKTWSFWKVIPHNFDDCVKKNWENFSINIPGKTNYLKTVTQGKYLWLRNNLSTITSQLLDTFIYTFTWVIATDLSIYEAFYIALSKYIFKIFIALIDTIFIYGVRNINPLVKNDE